MSKASDRGKRPSAPPLSGERPSAPPRITKASDAQEERPFVIGFDKAGHLDASALARNLDLATLREWMVGRFEGRDPFLPVDLASLETAHQVFVDLATRGPAELRSRISQVLAEILEKEWAEKNTERSRSKLVRQALRLAIAIIPAEAKNLLREVVQAAPFEQDLAEKDLELLWLEAAAVQPLDADVSVWAQLLDEQRYADLAFTALGQRVELAVQYFEKFWRAIPRDERQVATNAALRRLVNQHTDSIINELKTVEQGRIPPSELKQEINHAVKELGRPSVFPETQYKGLSAGERYIQCP